MTNKTAGRLTHDECLAWAERYASTPWNMLALSTSADKQPSALTVLKSALLNADAVVRDAVEMREALTDLHAEVEMAESVGICLPDRVPSLRAGSLLARAECFGEDA